MSDVLRPLPITEFLSIVNASGFTLTEDDLEQMERRRLISRPKVGFTRLHLYVVALYFDSITVRRHPWNMQSSERTVDDVKVASALVAKITEGADPSAASELALELERFVNAIDPFGPLGQFIDMLKPEAVQFFRGEGRLYAELLRAARALVDKSEGVPDGMVPTGQTTRELTGEFRDTMDIDASELELDESAETARSAPPIPSQETRPVTPEPESSPPDGPAATAGDDVTATADGEHAVQDSDEADAASAFEEEEPAEEAAEPQEEQRELEEQATQEASEPEEEDDEEDEEPEAAPEADADEAPASVSTPPDEDDTQEISPPAEDDEEEDEDEDFEGEDTTLTEVPAESAPASAAATPPTMPSDKETGFERETSKSGRTQALLERLEAIKAQRSGDDEESEEEDAGSSDLQARVEELNKRRQELMQAQDWAGLVRLYEDGLDLFEDANDRQQVLLTLANLYELKLDNPEKAAESVSRAFEVGDDAGRARAVEAFKRLTSRAGGPARLAGWLEEQTSGLANGELLNSLQRELSSALKEAGEGQRAFLRYASYLAEDLDARATLEAMDFLDELSLDVNDDEMEAFFADVTEQDTSPETKHLLATRAGMFFVGNNQTHHAIRYFRVALEADPASSVAFGNLSRLYEKEGNLGDLAALLEHRIAHADADEAARLRADLDKVVQSELGDEDSLTAYITTLKENPNDETALDRVVRSNIRSGSQHEVYAMLKGMSGRLEREQSIRVATWLGRLALEHLDSPAEAAAHFQQALELGGPNRLVLEGLVNSRVATEQWNEAVAVVRLLTNGSVELEQEKLVDWLETGIQAAERAGRSDDASRFEKRLAEVISAGT